QADQPVLGRLRDDLLARVVLGDPAPAPPDPQPYQRQIRRRAEHVVLYLAGLRLGWRRGRFVQLGHAVDAVHAEQPDRLGPTAPRLQVPPTGHHQYPHRIYDPLGDLVPGRRVVGDPQGTLPLDRPADGRQPIVVTGQPHRDRRVGQL